MYGRPDMHLYGAGPLAPAAARPELAGVVCHRHYGRVVGAGQCGATAAEPDRLTGGDTGPLGEYQYPEALTQPLAADTVELLQGAAGLAAIDGDGFHQGKGPAEEGYVQQLLLDQLGLGCEYQLQEEGFPGALVVGEDHTGLVRDVLQTGHPVIDADHRSGQPDSQTAPALQHQLETQPVRQEGADQDHGDGPEHGAGGQQQVEQDDTQAHEHGHDQFSSRRVATAARLSNTRVPSGSAFCSVCAPFPVRTR